MYICINVYMKLKMVAKKGYSGDSCLGFALFPIIYVLDLSIYHYLHQYFLPMQITILSRQIEKDLFCVGILLPR